MNSTSNLTRLAAIMNLIHLAAGPWCNKIVNSNSNFGEAGSNQGTLIRLSAGPQSWVI
jgi:hypothetical protein